MLLTLSTHGERQGEGEQASPLYQPYVLRKGEWLHTTAPRSQVRGGTSWGKGPLIDR